MKDKPVIGVIRRKEDNFLERYKVAVEFFGGICKYLPNYKEDILEEIKKCDGIIFTGGSSWNFTEEIILEYALNNKLPFLGICLGMQMIGNYFSSNHEYGVDKTKKINSSINHNCKKEYCHSVLLKDGLLTKIFNTNEILVNSYHNFKVSDTIDSIIKGYSKDGVIEALEISNHPFGVGVQWHPEKIINDCHSISLFKNFIHVAKVYQNNRK